MPLFPHLETMQMMGTTLYGGYGYWNVRMHVNNWDITSQREAVSIGGNTIKVNLFLLVKIHQDIFESNSIFKDSFP